MPAVSVVEVTQVSLILRKAGTTLTYMRSDSLSAAWPPCFFRPTNWRQFAINRASAIVQRHRTADLRPEHGIPFHDNSSCFFSYKRNSYFQWGSMTVQIQRPLVLVAVLVLLSGCGGGSGGMQAGGDSTAVTFSFSTETPNVVAAKMGASSFTAQSLISGKLTLSVPSGTTSFAVAYVCSAPSFPTIESIFEATIADGTSFILPCLAPSLSQSTGVLSGNVDASAIPGADQLNIAASNSGQSSVDAVTPDTTFNLAVPVGTDRVQVLAYNSVNQGLPTTSTLLAVRNFDNQTVPGSLNGGLQVVLGTADQTTLEPITYGNVPTGYSAPSTLVRFMMNEAGGVILSESTTQYPALPVGAVESGDTYELLAHSNNSANPTESMTVTKTFTSAGPVSFAFPAPWSYPGPVPRALPAFDFLYSGFSGKTGVSNLALIFWNSPASQIQITASANYQNGSTTLAIPDLSGLSGFIPPPPSGTQIIWAALIGQNSLGIQQPRTANSTNTAVQNGGSYTVP